MKYANSGRDLKVGLPRFGVAVRGCHCMEHITNVKAKDPRERLAGNGYNGRWVKKPVVGEGKIGPKNAPRWKGSRDRGRDIQILHSLCKLFLILESHSE